MGGGGGLFNLTSVRVESLSTIMGKIQISHVGPILMATVLLTVMVEKSLRSSK